MYLTHIQHHIVLALLDKGILLYWIHLSNLNHASVNTLRMNLIPGSANMKEWATNRMGIDIDLGLLTEDRKCSLATNTRNTTTSIACMVRALQGEHVVNRIEKHACAIVHESNIVTLHITHNLFGKVCRRLHLLQRVQTVCQ